MQAQASESGEPASGTLFVGDLSRSIAEEDLVRAFSAFGEVLEASIKRDRFSQRNLGYGFVQMASRAQAEEALKHMHGTELAGRQIRVNWAQRTARLFAGNASGRLFLLCSPRFKLAGTHLRTTAMRAFSQVDCPRWSLWNNCSSCSADSDPSARMTSSSKTVSSP